MIAAGQLTHRIAIHTPTHGTPDARGTRAVNWDAILDIVWARIEPVAPKWTEQAKAIAPTASHRITIRHRTDVTSRHRIEIGPRVFAINAVLDPKESKEDTILYCTEKLP